MFPKKPLSMRLNEAVSEPFRLAPMCHSGGAARRLHTYSFTAISLKYTVEPPS